MGQANCACVKNVSIDHSIEIGPDRKLPSNRMKETSHFSQEVDQEIRLLKSIIKIQALLRGWLARRKFHSVQVMLYNSKVNKLLKEFSTTHLTKFSKMPPFPFNEYSYPALENDDFENRFFRNAVLLENGAIYIGEWANEKKNGKGIQIWKDGSIYEGFWARDMATGKGRLYHANGDIYEGDWEEHKSKGQGVYIHADGARYEGAWNNDLQNGYGVETWPDGAKYEGEYLNGMKHGKGKFLWSDQASYGGEFLNNQINGLGKYIWPDGRKFCGEWVNNKMHGKGLFSWSDGRIYIGEYVDDKKSGQGVFEWYKSLNDKQLLIRPDGRKYVGQWLEGKQHGKGIFMTGNGQRKQGEWKNGQRDRWVIFDQDSEMLEQLEKKMEDLKNYYNKLDDNVICGIKSQKQIPQNQLQTPGKQQKSGPSRQERKPLEANMHRY